MKIDDYEKIYKLWTSCEGMGLYDTDDSKAGIEKFLQRNPDTCFVAADGDEIVGSILAGSDGRRAYIYHTAVHPDYRKRGVGKNLVNEAVAALLQMGVRKAALVVFCNNDAGNRFWKNMGFKTRNDLAYRDKELFV